MILPTFLVVGAMKAGTTSLHAYLASHPDITMSEPKELDFFVVEKHWSRGVDWYASHFAHADADAPRGETSPNYTKHPTFAGVPERIAQVLPDVRLVYLVRDPIERMRSHLEHAVRHGAEARRIDVELLENPHLQACSRYGEQLAHHLRHMPADRVLVLPSARLRTDTRSSVRRVVEFVGADPDRLPDPLPTEQHRSRDTRTPGAAALRDARRRRRDDRRLDAVRPRLRELFLPDLARLHDLAGVVLPGWEDAAS